MTNLKKNVVYKTVFACNCVAFKTIKIITLNLQVDAREQMNSTDNTHYNLIIARIPHMNIFNTTFQIITFLWIIVIINTLQYYKIDVKKNCVISFNFN